MKANWETVEELEEHDKVKWATWVAMNDVVLVVLKSGYDSSAINGRIKHLNATISFAGIIPGSWNLVLWLTDSKNNYHFD